MYNDVKFVLLSEYLLCLRLECVQILNARSLRDHVASP
jgi:hypothetical protein